MANIFDRSGYTPIMYAAYKNHQRACEMLIDFALQDDEPKGPLNGGSGETGDRRRLLERKK